MRIRSTLAAVVAVCVAGCTDVVDMVPVNTQAQAVGSPRLFFARGVPGGVMKITMPDGENLPGSFRIDETVTPGPDGPTNFFASAVGPRTRLVCRGYLSAGHGNAECREQDGAVYRLPI